VVGASAATGTAVSLEWRRSHDENRRWLRDKLDAAYQGALLNLLRTEGLRSGFTAQGGSYLTKEDQARWFDALVEARSSLQELLALCGDASRDEIAAADAGLSEAASELLAGRGLAGARIDIFAVAANVRTTVVTCARRDLRRDAAF
jgi:hypothetical protein